MRELLIIDEFLDERPDMMSFGKATIQSAINQAKVLLDSETNGLMVEVWNYNYANVNDPNGGIDNQMGAPDPTNKLYRTNWELGQIKQAMISQTQYNLNMGNDFSTGSESFSIGGVNGSFQRPLERQVIAPAVYKLLQNARVYKLNSYGMSFSNSEEEIQEECDFITREVADKRYLAQYQPNVKKGNVAYVNNSNMIDFGDPQDLNITTYNTINIKDPQTNEYVPLNKVLDILFRGKDLYGPYSGVERGELLNIVSLVNMNWNQEMFYRKDTLLSYAYVNDKGKWLIQDFLAKRDNRGKNPLESPEDWQSLGTVQADINQIVELTLTRVKEIYDPEIQSIKDSQSNFETKLNGDFDTLRQDLTSQFTQLQETITNNFNALKQEINTNLPVQVEQEVNKQLDALPTIEYINTIFLKGQVAFFKSNVELQDFTTKHNLQENVDYNLLDQQIIGVSPTGTPFGDSLIKMNQTPQLKWGAYVIGGGSDNPNEGFSNMFITSYNQWIIGPGGWGGANFRFQNYVGDQQPFTPRINKPLIGVEFLKDINEIKKGVVRGINND